jgi:hypothetical protein
MQKNAKTGQLQVRVTPAEKRAIQRQAAKAQKSMSEWVLERLLPSSQIRLRSLVDDLAASSEPSYVFAEILELIESMPADEFEGATSELRAHQLNPYWQNYLAATLEHAATLKQAKAPGWTTSVPPLDSPVFGSHLESLRLHLLVNTPPPFLQRNIFIDASIGKRV